MEADNNRVENAIHPPPSVTRTWLFMGDDGVGQRGAILYTVTLPPSRP
jgi:hypothetical protein